MMLRTPGNACCVVVGAVLAFLVSGCTSSPDPAPGASSAPRTSTTATPKATPSATRTPTAARDYQASDIHVSSAKLLTSGRLSIAVVGPEDTTFRVKQGLTTVGCIAVKKSLDAKAAKGLNANSVQHYALECDQNSAEAGKKRTLLTTVVMAGGSGEFSIPLKVVSAQDR